MHRFIRRITTATMMLLVAGSTLHAQDGGALTIIGGASQYDLSGTGTGPFVALRYERVVRPAIIVEAGIGYMTDKQEFRNRQHYVFPEIMVQLQVPRGSLRPYLGVGSGIAFTKEGDINFTDFTLAAAGGLRIMTSSPWSFRGELRIRAVDPWTGTTANWGFGISRSF